MLQVQYVKCYDCDTTSNTILSSFLSISNCCISFIGPVMLLLCCSSSRSFLSAPSFIPLPLTVLYSAMQRDCKEHADYRYLSARLRQTIVRNHKHKMQSRLLKVMHFSEGLGSYKLISRNVVLFL